ncbi:hypothetical protein G6F55_014646 [Rhizopus delemar]|nr:hypothetical protein G6F55_014646 [Rhizopus delemar]
MVLQRYELLFEAGLVPEAARRGAGRAVLPGEPMRHDHRRILATGIARLRAKINCNWPWKRWPGEACTNRISAV